MKARALISLIVVGLIIFASFKTDHFSSSESASASRSGASTKSDLRQSPSREERHERHQKKIKDLIYQEFPDLEPPEKVENSSTASADFLDWFSRSEFLEKEIPEDLLKMARGEGELDFEQISAFLEQNGEVFEELLKLAELPPGGLPRNLGISQGNEIAQIGRYASCLSLVALLELESGNPAEAERLFRNQLAVAPHIRNGELFPHLVAGRAETSALFHASNAFPGAGFSEKQSGQLEGLIAGFQEEVDWHVPHFVKFESFRVGEEDLGDGFASETLEGFNQWFSGSEGETGSIPAHRLQEARDLPWDELYLTVLGEYNKPIQRALALQSWDSQVDPENPNDDVFVKYKERIAENQANGKLSLPFGVFLAGYSGFAEREAGIHRQLILREALNLAASRGESVNSLQELVPNYLPSLPVHPIRGEQFLYDPEANTLSTSQETQPLPIELPGD